MQEQLIEIVTQHYPSPRWSVEPLDTTRHENVVRIMSNEINTSYVAKGIFHIEGNGNLGPEQSDRAFANEKTILAQLPIWWGIRLVDAFRTEDARVIVTPELPTIPWRAYQSSVEMDRNYAASLERQLRWLRAHRIAHRDLELKNVLLTQSGPVIIDFEKATMDASPTEMATDWQKLVSVLRENENTRRLGQLLETHNPIGRRKSIGGTRKRKITRKKTRGTSRRKSKRSSLNLR